MRFGECSSGTTLGNSSTRLMANFSHSCCLSYLNTYTSDANYVDTLLKKGKGKAGRAPPEHRWGAHLPVKAIEPVGG